MANAAEKVRLEMDVEDEICREIDNRDRLIADLEAREQEATSHLKKMIKKLVSKGDLGKTADEIVQLNS